MQYNGYEIQTTADGCIIRDNKGNYLVATPTDEEAKEYIDDLIEENNNINISQKIDYYKNFILYCNKLPGKIFIDDKLATTNEAALNRFIKSFEKLHDVRVNYSNQYRGGEYFYIVEDII